VRCHHAGVRLTWQRCSLVICRNGAYAAAMVDGAHQFHGSSACRSWFLVMFERHGYGERLITWFKATGHAKRPCMPPSSPTCAAQVCCSTLTPKLDSPRAYPHFARQRPPGADIDAEEAPTRPPTKIKVDRN
jgi:hypothetical protein